MNDNTINEWIQKNDMEVIQAIKMSLISTNESQHF